MTNDTPKRGFAAFSSDRLREISRLGGQSIPSEKRFFSRNRDVASLAGKRGGVRRREASAKDLDLMLRSLDGPIELPLPTSGRMTIKINRLLRLNYWERVTSSSMKTQRFQVTKAGRDYLERLKKDRSD